MSGRAPCGVADCDRGSVCRGFCDKHYRRVLKYGDPHSYNGGEALGGQCSESHCVGAPVASDLCRKHYRAAWYARNRESVRAYNMKYYAENREKYAEWNAKWVGDNPARKRATQSAAAGRRRARMLEATSGHFSTEQLAQRMSMFDNSCWICGGPFQHVDHVKPLAAGGMHTLSNLRPSCANCNRRKNRTWPFNADALRALRESESVT